jgi:hypothetical protein
MPLLNLTLVDRYLVNAQVQFAASEDKFFIQYSCILCPTYDPPSAFTLSGEILASELAYVKSEQMKEVENGKMWTYLMDGWEDTQRQSLYASMLQKRGQPGIILDIKNMTGMQADGEALLCISASTLDVMRVRSTNLLVAVTDDPLVMRKFQRLFEGSHSHVLVSSRFLCSEYGG